jgi:hypothetical protein
VQISWNDSLIVRTGEASIFFFDQNQSLYNKETKPWIKHALEGKIWPLEQRSRAL